MTIQVGERVPEAVFSYVPYSPGLEDLSVCGTVAPYTIAEKWAGRKVVVVAVPGAFTPTCHVNHIPGYVKHCDAFKKKEIDVIAVIAANDPFVLSAWGRVVGFKEKVVPLSDTNAEWSKKLGLSLDLTPKGLGIRTGRYVLVLDDLVVQHVAVEEEPSKVDVSGAEQLLAVL